MKVLFSAGELSGDEHLSGLLNELRKLHSDASFRGMAGPKTRAQGFDTELKLEEFASVMGFSDVIRKIPTVLKALRNFEQLIREWKPEILIVVDYPDFNLKLCRIAKKYGVKTFYFIPPKIWAWRESRIRKIKEYVDCIALIFPFEKPFYEKLGYLKSYYVGHPFYGHLTKEASLELENVKKKSFFAANNLNHEIPTLAVFPGSRKSEIENHSEVVSESIRQLSDRIPDLQVLISAADTVKDCLAANYGTLKNTRIISGHNLEILRYADIGLIKSGTSNLQAAFYLLPFVMFYKSNKLTEKIVKTFVRIKQYSLVNIIIPDSIDEFVLDRFDSKAISDRLCQLLRDKESRTIAVSKLEAVREQLGDYEKLEIFNNSTGAYQRAALLVAQQINDV